jgi:hypothetical protein
MPQVKAARGGVAGEEALLLAHILVIHENSNEC